MGTSLSTFASSTTITRPTRNPPPISLLDFDPRKQIPPWVPDPDPHAHFLASGVGDVDGRVSPGGNRSAGSGEVNKRAESRREESGARGSRAANADRRMDRNPHATRRASRQEPLIAIDEEQEEEASGEEADSEGEVDYDNGDEEEYTNIDFNDCDEHQLIRNQSIHTSQDMYFRERYFARRWWMEENQVPYSWQGVGYGVGIGLGEVGGYGGEVDVGGRGRRPGAYCGGGSRGDEMGEFRYAHNGGGYRGGGGVGRRLGGAERGGGYYDVICRSQGMR